MQRIAFILYLESGKKFIKNEVDLSISLIKKVADNNKIKKIAIVSSHLAGAGNAVILAELIKNDLSGLNILHEYFIDNWPGNFEGYTDIFISG